MPDSTHLTKDSARLRTDAGVVGSTPQVFFECLGMERMNHLLTILCARAEASLPSMGSTVPFLISSLRRLTMSR
jgi:hypothetical protein